MIPELQRLSWFWCHPPPSGTIRTEHERMNPRPMKSALAILCLGTVVLVAACTTESAKRATFETLQNVRQQECEKNRDPDCQKRESYDEYQRQRQQEMQQK
jgi:hypothetical protein